jgi:hypothetical protein
MNRTAKDIALKLLFALSFAVGFNQRILEYKSATCWKTDGALYKHFIN